MKILFNALISIFLLLPIHVNACEVDTTETKGTFYFVRHGITDWSMDHLLDGPQDLPLNEKGKSDIQELATVFEKLDPSFENFPTSILYSSLKRCVQTMKILREKLPINKSEAFEGLKEVYRGDWSKLEGEAKDNAIKLLKAKDYVELAKIKIDDAEEWPAFLERIEKTIGGCLKHDPKHPIIVTHGQVVKEFLKLKKCWLPEIEFKWKGDTRSPLKVSYNGLEWSAELLE